MSKKKKPYLWLIPRDSIWHPLTKFLAIPVIAIVIVFLLVDEVIMPKITRHGEDFPLPDVTGMSITDAKELLARYEIDSVEIAGREATTPRLPEGTVIVQAPAAGSQVKVGRRVKVILSAGQEMVKVPPMFGFSERQARLKIRENGLRVGSFNWAVEDTMQIANVLVYTVPSEGSLVPEGTPINLYFSRGPQTNIVFVPQLLGLDLREAEMIVDSIGLNVARVDYAVNYVLVPNTVVWQSIPADTKVEIGSEIYLKVSVTD